MKYIEIDPVPVASAADLENGAMHHVEVPEGGTDSDLLFACPPKNSYVARSFFLSIDCPDELSNVPNWRLFGSSSETLTIIVPSENGPESLLLRPGANLYRFTEIAVSTFMVFGDHESSLTPDVDSSEESDSE